MSKGMTFLVFAMGLCLAIIGCWWLWTGLGIVVTERGWSSVIAGATMLSAGLVIVALSAVLRKLDGVVAAVRTRPVAQVGAMAPAASPPPRRPPAPSPVIGRPPAPTVPDAAEANGLPAAALPLSEAQAPSTSDHRETVGRHVSGDTTYVMFSDGTVEAHAPEGSVTFESLDALRAHAEEREAAGGAFRSDRRP